MTSHDLPKATVNRFPKQASSVASDSLFNTSVGTRLSSAIDRLYGAFEGCRLSVPLRCCPHCFTDADVRYIETTPLRQLSFEDAAFILPKTISTLGTESDFNYFIPRILETHAHQAHYMLATLAEKLRRARNLGWTPERLNAVLEFMRAYIRSANELEFNDSLYDDYGRMREGLRVALPELTEEMHLVGADAVEFDRLPSE